MAPATTDETLASAIANNLGLTSDNKPALSKEERLSLINENLAEILNPEIIEKVLDEGRDPRIYWGKYITMTSIWGAPLV